MTRVAAVVYPECKIRFFGMRADRKGRTACGGRGECEFFEREPTPVFFRQRGVHIRDELCGRDIRCRSEFHGKIAPVVFDYAFHAAVDEKDDVGKGDFRPLELCAPNGRQ
ncbi:hypothetical protein [uncultured Alistipes sp.]|uniref:hypothetical protein n=1 Tax=uncultured Alistipes sp. TaxID=538949 RepID=UPI0025F3447B|nr:hypothetical protein [uncultured Alistipes sp.]